MLLTQLAQLCVRKKRVEPPAEGEVEAAPTPPPTDPGAELDALLGDADKDPNPTARARILFAKAELARLRRQPAEEEKNIARIAETAKPEGLKPDAARPSLIICSRRRSSIRRASSTSA
jgi:hypothetical protein